MDTLKLKLATAMTEMTAPRTQRLKALSKAGVVAGKDGMAGSARRGVSGVIIGLSSFLMSFTGGDGGLDRG